MQKENGSFSCILEKSFIKYSLEIEWTQKKPNKKSLQKALKSDKLRLNGIFLTSSIEKTSEYDL